MAILIWLFTILSCTIYSQAQQFPDDYFMQLPPQDNNILTTNSKVQVDDLFLQIHTRKDPIGSRVSLTDGSDVASLSSFDVNLKTFIYTHGWRDTISNPLSIQLKQALLAASDANVLLLSWDKCASSINYISSYGCVEGTGNYLGEFLKAVQKSYGYSFDNVTLIGHSLGAHISGYAGKTTDGNLDLIVGLDPAGPLFSQGDKDHRLDKDDAKYVQIIHTCATGLVGLNYDVGDSDYWPNSGVGQPGCQLDLLLCPHLRAINYYTESLASDGFVGRNCDSYQDYENGKCGNGAKSVMGGLNVDKSAKGNYYLDTNDKSPFAKGDV